jgi:HAD superfamily hydrolase (TIGR01509 family)
VTRRGVILDIDGTLVDSNTAHAESWVETLAHHGYDVSVARMKSLIGMGGDKLLPAAIGVADDSELGKRLSEERSRLFLREYLPQLRAFPGGRELTQRLRRDGYTLVVASSAGQDHLERLIEIAGIADQLDDITSADDAARSKPAPDIVFAALKRGRLRPDEAIMLGDTPYDVESARRAGVGMVGVRSGGWSDAELSGALAVYDDVAELLRRYEESLFRRANS